MDISRETMKRRMLSKSIASVSILFILCLWCHPYFLINAEATDAGSDRKEVVAHGYFSARYVDRKAESDDGTFQDADLNSELRYDLESNEQYGFHFLGTVRSDVDGKQDSSSFNSLEDIGDARSGRAAGYVYEANLELKDTATSVKQVRIGRQAGTRAESIFFDGIAADVQAAKELAVTLFAGAAVHFHEFGQDAMSDTLAGLGADYTPAPATTVSLDYLFTKDKRTQPLTGNRHDGLVSLSARRRFTQDCRGVLKYNAVNGESRDASLRFLSAFPGSAADVNVYYARQFRTQNELANELSPLYDVLGQSHPYQTIDIRARKVIGSRLAVDAGYIWRSLVHQQDESAFNREYIRTFATLEFLDVWLPGLSVNATGEQWEAGDRRFTSGGADVAYAPLKHGKIRFSAGTYFSLYKYDYYILPGERQHVRTNYLDMRIPAGKGFLLTAAYEIEAGPEDYQTARLGMRYDF